MPLGRTNINLPQIALPLKGVYLYKEGDECTDISGGWSTKYGNSAISSTQTGCTGNPTRTKEEDHLLISIPDQTYANASDRNMTGSWYTNNKINLTDFDKIVVDVEISYGASLYGGDYYGSVGYQIASGQYTNSTVMVANAAFRTTNDNPDNNGRRRLLELDVSNLSGEFYIVLYASRGIPSANAGDDSVKLKAYNVYLL